MTNDSVNGRGGIRWCYPVLPVTGYSIQPGCGYLSPGYYNATGSVHPGADFNGTGGSNTDLGDTIYAAADGVVTEAAVHRVWGWVVVIRHSNVGGGYNTVETQYAHAEKASDVLVRVGDHVRCGQPIMRMGRGGVNAKGSHYFYAHLHFEVRTRLGIPGDDWPSTGRSRSQAEQYTISTRDDPARFLEYMNAAKSLTELQAETVVRPVPAVVKPSTPVTTPAFDLSTVELLDQSGHYVPLPGADVIYKGLRITRDGSKLKIHPKEVHA